MRAARARGGTRSRRRETGGGRTAAAERLVRDAADRDDPAAARELAHERQPAAPRASGGGSTRSSPGWVGTTFQSSTSSATPSSASTPWTIVAVASAGPVARELPLRRERDAGDARAAVAGRLADEQDRRLRPLVEVPPSRRAQQRGARTAR